ncbi:formamidopyrimidine-DNA glycosylase [Psychromicrobium silvestre]|uniref:Formamidopyrimidine-DNA glycosylase n=1 Tax=Psychromicrobium silvestre TaxID=1645614 RepID=A0A7Y9LVE6_9MICC|nr:Fpg/Nei family DNA glycosylase [Psychromicrobium silvestre]NYE96327.1 formamidopyrimidine-DNA glycosylase [Psychromicrobium silvestre]
MPELPELVGLSTFLDTELHGVVLESLQIASFTALKTASPASDELLGRALQGVGRQGKFVDLRFGPSTTDDGELHLIFHLAKAGWLRFSRPDPAESASGKPLKPGGYITARLGFESARIDLTEAGTRKSLAIYVVRNPSDIPGIATLGPDPLAEDFTVETLAAILAPKRAQIKGVLRDQRMIAGIGNAYSDEILHLARLSPFAPSNSLSEEQIGVLFQSIKSILAEAIASTSGKPAAELKDAKRSGMRVHARTGEACPVCGDTIREVAFADRSLQYCPSCQTGGKLLADRRMSRLLK